MNVIHTPQNKLFLQTAKLILAALVILGVVFWLYVSGHNLHNPLADTIHSFRQSQTGLTIYWFYKSGFQLDYLTPVLGPPYKTPFEFPIYQFISSVLMTSGLSAEASGRIVSAAFYAGSLVFFYQLGRLLNFSTTHILVFLVLTVFSPLYMYWSSSVLVESTALFFSLGFLYFSVRYILSDKVIDGSIGIAALFGVVAIVTKSTTFSSYGFVIGFYSLSRLALWSLNYDLKKRDFTTDSVKYLVILVICAIILMVGLSWVYFTDGVKEISGVSRIFMSEKLQKWNYGSLEQRLSFDFYSRIFNRMVPDALGVGGMLILLSSLAYSAILLIAKKVTIKRAVLISSSLVIVVFPLAVFSNLHFVHNYYQFANFWPLMVLVAVPFTDLLERKFLTLKIFSILLLVFVVFSQKSHFDNFFSKSIFDLKISDIHEAAVWVRENSNADDEILVLGDDWSSRFVFAAERKGLVLMDYLAKDVADDLTDVLGQWVDLVADCGFSKRNDLKPVAVSERIREGFVQSKELVFENKRCKVYRW